MDLNHLVLLALVMGIVTLFGLGLLSWFNPRQHRAGRIGLTVTTGAIALIAVPVLVGGIAADLALPFGLPGTNASLRLDPLAAIFLLVLSIPACAGAGWDLADAAPGPIDPTIPFVIAGSMVGLLAADVVLWLVVGAIVLLVLGLAAVHAPPHANTSRAGLVVLVGFGGFVGTLALLAAGSPATIEPGFPGLRAIATDGPWIPLLATLSAGLLTFGPRIVAAAAFHGSSSALLHAGLRVLPIYGVIRVLADLSGPAQPVWWGLPLLVMGVVAAVWGARSAGRGDSPGSVLAAVTDLHLGILFAGVGIALLARGADLAPLATLAMAATLLHALHHAVFVTLLWLGNRAIEGGAGTSALDHLGGLIHTMPVTSLCLLAGGFAASILPPGAAFASLWLLWQAVFAAPRAGGLGLGVLLGVMAGALALALTLGTASLLRLLGVALLGRPRTPRVAAAQEVGKPAQTMLIGMAVFVGLLGLLPSVTVALIAPAARFLMGSDVASGPAIFLRPAADLAPGASGYAALPFALLVLAAGGLVWLVLRGHSVPGHRRAAAWNDGFAAPPPWLPLGDPATQASPDGLARALDATLEIGGAPPSGGAGIYAAWSRGGSWLRDRMALIDAVGPRHVMVLLFAVLVLLLALQATR